MVIYEKESAQLLFDSTIPCIIWTPLKFVSSELFREPFKVGMDLMEKKIKTMPDIGWLNDTRSLKSVKIEDLKWLNTNVNSRAYKFGAKKVAFVLPTDALGRTAVKFYIDHTNRRSDNSFHIKAFKSIYDAKTWLNPSNNIQVDEEII